MWIWPGLRCEKAADGLRNSAGSYRMFAFGFVIQLFTPQVAKQYKENALY